jgi:hypothetical protein
MCAVKERQRTSDRICSACADRPSGDASRNRALGARVGSAQTKRYATGFHTRLCGSVTVVGLLSRVAARAPRYPPVCRNDGWMYLTPSAPTGEARLVEIDWTISEPIGSPSVTTTGLPPGAPERMRRLSFSVIIMMAVSRPWFDLCGVEKRTPLGLE